MTTATLPFHADTVGSYLRTQPLKEARAKFAAAEISREQLTEIEDQEIAKLVQAQLNAGINVITDGEFRRAFWHIDFLENLNGLEGRLCISRANKKLYIKQRLTKLITSKTTV